MDGQQIKLTHCLFLVWCTCICRPTLAVLHQTSLLWTEKSFRGGNVMIKGIPGDPSVWVQGGEVPFVSQTGPSDGAVAAVSHRVALAFKYNSRELFFTDRGLKEVYKIKVREGSGPTSYQVPVERVYHGTSSIVNGLAVDWLSGTIYWTDGLYNWISMGSVTNHNVFRHVITTGLDGPTGIAVNPQLGKMYWGEVTGIPKIEVADLDGANRKTFTSTDVSYPIGVTVDYDQGRLYWVDDFVDSIESADIITGLDRRRILINDPDSYKQYVFGIAVYQDYIFVSDQYSMDIKVWNKTTEALLHSHPIALGQPYDVMMYDSSLQEDMDSDCSRLQCDHMCISTGNGGGKCVCGHGAELGDDGKTCTSDGSFTKPRYIYTIGNELCTTPISYPDRKDELANADVNCFHGNLAHAEALAVHVDAELLFYSDTKERTISKVYLGDATRNVTRISLQRGLVRGMAVDWVNSILYWTDEEHGHIMASGMDGNFPNVILDNLDAPRGIEVDPSTGTMYFASPTNIYSAAMDGSGLRTLWGMDNVNLDGMTLDHQSKRLYWVDKSLPGIRSMFTNGTDAIVYLQAEDETIQFRDLTTYQDYIAWTNGSNSVMFAKTVRNATTGRRYPELLKAVQHFTSDVSHDIVTYDEYAQPPASEGVCDDENGGCSQLCLPATATVAVCKCSVGFVLDADRRTCKSDLKEIEKIMFIDPYHRQMYELDMELSSPTPQGISLQMSRFPDQYTYDSGGKRLFWVDTVSSAIKTQPLDYHNKETVVLQLPKSSNIGEMDVHLQSKKLFYTEQQSNTIYQMSLTNYRELSAFTSGNLFHQVMAVDNVNDLVIWAEAGRGESTDLYTLSVDAGDSNKPQAKQLLLSAKLYFLGIAVDPTGEYLYYWTNYEVGRIALGSKTTVQAEPLVAKGDFEAEFQSVAVYGNSIYFSQVEKTNLYQINLKERSMGTVDTVIGKLFSKIDHLKSFRIISQSSIPSVDPNDPTNGNSKPGGKNIQPGQASSSTQGSSSAFSTTNIAIIGGASAGVVLIIAVILTAVCLCTRKRQKKLPPTSANTGAHDNPTYMTSGQVARVPGAQNAEGNAPRSAPEGVYDELPPYNAAGDAEPTYLEPREIDEHAKALGLSTGDAPPVDEGDNAELVNNMADCSEVVLQVDHAQTGAVAFKKGNENV